jgi:signal transduction histidine kinase
MISKQDTFTLNKQFSLLSFFSILMIGIVSTYLMSLFFTKRILEREAVISKDFVESIIAAEGTWSLFLKDGPNESARLKLFFTHIANMPDIIRANIYGNDKSVLWSSAPEIVDSHMENNPGLNAALKGELVYESSIIKDATLKKYMFKDDNILGIRFIETYIPVWNRERNAVLGVAELYKAPRALHESIIEGQRLIWIIALTGGLLLFISLYWIVNRASRVMQNQQQQLIENKSLSMIGKTASAITHAMRSPLASIRACAEMTLSDDLEGARESALDIIGETDRLDRWVREFLQFSATSTAPPDDIDVNEMVRDVLKQYESILHNSSTYVELELEDAQLYVQAHYAPFSQVLGNLIMNAVEAMEESGNLIVHTAYIPRHKNIAITIKDNGPGLPKEIRDHLFTPFTTTKSTGMGLGLPLSRYLLEHYGGTLDIVSERGLGVTATISLPESENLI